MHAVAEQDSPAPGCPRPPAALGVCARHFGEDLRGWSLLPPAPGPLEEVKGPGSPASPNPNQTQPASQLEAKAPGSNNHRLCANITPLSHSPHHLSALRRPPKLYRLCVHGVMWIGKRSHDCAGEASRRFWRQQTMMKFARQRADHLAWRIAREEA